MPANNTRTESRFGRLNILSGKHAYTCTVKKKSAIFTTTPDERIIEFTCLSQ